MIIKVKVNLKWQVSEGNTLLSKCSALFHNNTLAISMPAGEIVSLLITY